MACFIQKRFLAPFYHGTFLSPKELDTRLSFLTLRHRSTTPSDRHSPRPVPFFCPKIGLSFRYILKSDSINPGQPFVTHISKSSA